MITFQELLNGVGLAILILAVFFLILFSVLFLTKKRKNDKNEYKTNFSPRISKNHRTNNSNNSQASFHNNAPRTQSDYIQRKKDHQGRIGELTVSSILGDSLPRVRYVFNDTLIKLNNKTAQIDHILVNRAGIFIIETKNFSGEIYGNENDETWVQYSPKGIKNAFYNPIKQNESHIKIMREIIGEDYPVFSFIVFVNSTPNVSSKNVIHISQLRSRIIDTSLAISLSSDEIMQVASIIRNHISHSSADRAKHVEDAKRTASLLSEGRCPRCHKKLVLRKKPYSEFWECSGAPHCSYTKPVK